MSYCAPPEFNYIINPKEKKWVRESNKEKSLCAVMINMPYRLYANPKTPKNKVRLVMMVQGLYMSCCLQLSVMTMSNMQYSNEENETN